LESPGLHLIDEALHPHSEPLGFLVCLGSGRAACRHGRSGRATSRRGRTARKQRRIQLNDAVSHGNDFVALGLEAQQYLANLGQLRVGSVEVVEVRHPSMLANLPRKAIERPKRLVARDCDAASRNGVSILAASYRGGQDTRRKKVPMELLLIIIVLILLFGGGVSFYRR
jgi:hypothetical protein